MRNSDYIFRTTSEAFGRLSAPQRKCFSNVLGGGHVEKRVFTCFSTVIMAFKHVFGPSLPINMLQMFTISHTLFSSSHFPSTTICFHRWPFIERGLFGNPSWVICSVNREGVSLGMRLVCLSVSLTIMVSCSLEAPVPLCLPSNSETTGMSYQLQPLV